MNTQYRVDLVQFKDLKALAWRGLNRYSDFESIKDCFSTLGHQLSSLTLDLVNWDRAMKIWADGFRRQSTQDIPDNFFAQNVLNISPRDNGVHFQSLKYLHLSGVSLCHVEAQMLHSFNIESIKSLELRNCPGSLDLLQQALTPRKTLKLRELELSLDINSLQRPAHVRSTQIICEFIQHVNHLEVLHLMLPEPFDWDSLAFTISTCTCLKSLVMHHLIDRGGQNLIDGGIPWPSYLGDVLQAKELTCFGSSTPPDELATQLRKAQRRPSCRLLHIRASGVVLERLANQSNWSSAPVYNFKYGDGKLSSSRGRLIVTAPKNLTSQTRRMDPAIFSDLQSGHLALTAFPTLRFLLGEIFHMVAAIQNSTSFLAKLVVMVVIEV